MNLLDEATSFFVKNLPEWSFRSQILKIWSVTARASTSLIFTLLFSKFISSEKTKATFCDKLDFSLMNLNSSKLTLGFLKNFHHSYSSPELHGHFWTYITFSPRVVTLWFNVFSKEFTTLKIMTIDIIPIEIPNNDNIERNLFSSSVFKLNLNDSFRKR